MRGPALSGEPRHLAHPRATVRGAVRMLLERAWDFAHDQRLVLRNGLYAWLGLGFSTLVVLGVTPVLLRLIGPEQFGLWTLVMGIVMLAGFADQGLGVGAGRYVAHYASRGDHDSLASTITAAIVIAVVAGLVLGGCICLLAQPISSVIRTSGAARGTLPMLLQLAGLGVVAILLRTASMAGPVGLQRFQIVAVFTSLQTALPWVAAAGLAWRGASIVAVVLGSVAALWVVALAGLGVAGTMLATRARGPRLSVRHTVHIARYCLVSMGAGMGTQVFTALDRVAVGVVLGAAPLAYYTIATGVATKLNQIMGVFWQPLMPASSALLAARESSRLQRHLLQATVASVAVNAVTAAAAVLTAAPLLEWWLGASYEDIVLRPLQILVVVYAVFSVAAPAWHMALGVGAAGACATIALVAGILSVALIVPLGHAVGLNGAAAANTAYVLTLVLVPYLLRRLGARGPD